MRSGASRSPGSSLTQPAGRSVGPRSALASSTRNGSFASTVVAPGVGAKALTRRVSDAAGSLHAFLNSCAHRAARLLEGRGSLGARIVCPYHGWAYGHDGQLAGISHEPTFGSVDRGCYGLRSLPCQEKYGFVYAAASGAIR